MKGKRNKVDAHLLKRYHQGACTQEECELIENWLNSPPLEDELDYVEIPKNPDREDASWINLKKQLIAKEDEETSSFRTKVAHFNRKWFAITASIVLIISLGLLTFYFMGWSTKSESVVLMTAPGQKLKTRLPDGTLIILNAGSKLSYFKPFINNKREVTLVGEAWFDVKQDTHRPFCVKTAYTLTEVLGTRFNLNTFNKGVDEIYVENGQIKFNLLSDKKVAMILAAEQGAQSTLSGKNIILRSNPEASAWKDNRLIFKDTPLVEVCAILSRWFGLDIRLSDKSLRALPYTATFNAPNVNEVLRNIAFVTNTSFRINAQQVTIE